MTWRIDLITILSLLIVSSCVPNGQSNNKQKKTSINSESTVMVGNQESNKDSGSKDTTPPSLPGLATFNKLYNASNFPLQFTWGASADANLSGYNYKICGTSDCKTSCKEQQSSVGTLVNGTITVDRVIEGVNYVCVQAYDSYKNSTSFISVGSFIADTIVPNALSFKLQGPGSHKEYTNKNSITWIAETIKDASQMCLTNSQNSANCNWVSVATSGNYTLPSGDGLKTVYLFYRDTALNVSKPISASITLDQISPTQPKFSTVSGYDATILNGTDINFDHYFIKYCDSDYCTKILGSFETKSPQFSFADMAQKYKLFYFAIYSIDLADNISSVAFGSITISATPPTSPGPSPTTSLSLPGFATLNKYYNAGNFPMQFNWGASAGTDLSGYNYKTCGSSDCRTSCKEQQSSIGTIPSGTINFDRVIEGVNYACVQAYDTKKNSTSFVNVGSFTVDTIAPIASTFTLQSSGSHKEYTNKVNNIWAAGNVSGATQMCLTNSQSFADCSWISFATSGSHALSVGDGLKTVYLFYRDEALNVSKPISASIVLDQTTPSNVALSLSNSNANIIGGSDTNFDYYKIRFCDSPECSNIISSFQTKTTQFSLSEMIALNKTFYTAVYAIDFADNISNLTILTYTAAPTGPTIPTIPAPTNPVIKDIAIAPSSMCIAFAGGIVKCVGYNKYGELGFSSVIESSLTDLKTIPTHYFGTDFEVAQLTTGASFYCALSTKGAVKCWGMNTGGAIGQEASDAVLVLPPYTPSNVDIGSDRPVQLSTGGGYNCILTEYGDIKCWGYNAFAQLGLGHQNNIGVSPGQMGLNLKKVNLGTNIKATKVTAGGSFTCALLNTRQVKCWGMGALGNDTYRSNSGQLDDYIGSTPSHMGDNLLPVYLGEDVIDISAGGTHMCALLASGKAKCWGNNMQAQLGQEDNENRGDNTTSHSMTKLTPINFGNNKVLKIFAGPYYTCMILDNGKTKCWGNDSAGNLGQGHRNTAVYYTRLSTVDYLDFGTGVDAYKIYTGSSLSCALMTNGKVKCWGSGYLINRAAQNNLGDEPNEMGDNLPYLDFTAVNTPPTTPTVPNTPETPNAVVKAIAMNGSSICLAFSAGRVKCMGFNSNGQMGYYSFEYGSLADLKNVPTHNFGSDFEVAQLSTEGLLYCALSTKGAVKCWGGDFQGSMGQGYNAGGMSVTYFTPKNVDIGPDRAIQVATSPAHSCIVTIKGEVKCWGMNFYGQLGIGNKNNIGDDINEMGSNLKAVNLGTNLKAIKVVVGGNYTCALLNNYKVKCWGWDSHGALGNNILPSVPSFGGDYIGTLPAQMGDNLRPVYLEEDAVDISSSSTHVCVILASGKAKCWGDNAFYQLGLGDTVNRGNNDTDRAMENLSLLNFGSNKVLKILAAGSKSCAILDNGDAKCWGRNYPGNLGQEKYDPVSIKLSEVKKLDVGAGNKISTLYGSYSNFCALLTSGKLKCWGDRDIIDRGYRGVGDKPGEMGDNLPYIDLGF